MPPVPQYNREVGAQLTPTPYRDDRVNGDTFGVNVYKAQQGLGDTLGNAGQHLLAGMMHLKDKYDRTKLIEFSNELQQYEQDNIRNGYYKTTGKEAMGGSTKVMEDWGKNGQDLLNKYGFHGYNQARAKDILLGYTAHVQKGVEAHDFQESERWNNTVFDDAYNNVLTNASFNRHDPAGLARTFKNLNTLIDNDQRYQKLDPELKQIYKYNLEAKMHMGVLDSLIGEGSLAAQVYFENNKDKIPAAKQADYVTKITRMGNMYEARNTAQQLMAIDPMEAYSQIDSIENIELRDATESEYNRLLRQNEMAQKEIDRKTSNEIMQKVYSAYDNGQDISDIMREVNISPMSLEQKDKIYKNLKTMQELEGVGNNWADYNILLDMAAYNNEEFKNINLAEYNLTKEQYNKMTEMQRSASENQYSPETALREAIDKVSGFNFVTQNDLSKKEYENELIRFLSKVERMQGKAFDYKNPYQLESILAGFEYKDTTAKDKNLDETKELFTRAKKRGEVYDAMAREYMLFKGQNKREPNPDEIYEMAKRSYATIENNWRKTDKGKFDAAYGIYHGIQNTTPKEGETKVLTYYADTRIPEISKELGFDLRVTSRYRKGDAGGHGQGRKCDIGMNGLSAAQRMAAFEKLLQEPAIASIGTSDPILLKRYNNPENGKIRDLREYDANYRKKHPNTTMNHVNHFDVSFNLKYNEQPQYSTPRLI